MALYKTVTSQLHRYRMKIMSLRIFVICAEHKKAPTEFCNSDWHFCFVMLVYVATHQ